MKFKWSNLFFAALTLFVIGLMHWLTTVKGVSPVWGIPVVFGAAIVQTLFENFEEKCFDKSAYIVSFYFYGNPDFIYTALLIRGKVTVFNDTMTTYYKEYSWYQVKSFIDNGIWVVTSIKRK